MISANKVCSSMNDPMQQNILNSGFVYVLLRVTNICYVLHKRRSSKGGGGSFTKLHDLLSLLDFFFGGLLSFVSKAKKIVDVPATFSNLFCNLTVPF